MDGWNWKAAQVVQRWNGTRRSHQVAGKDGGQFCFWFLFVFAFIVVRSFNLVCLNLLQRLLLLLPEFPSSTPSPLLKELVYSYTDSRKYSLHFTSPSDPKTAIRNLFFSCDKLLILDHLPGGGGTPIYGPYRYVRRNRVWFLRFSVRK